MRTGDRRDHACAIDARSSAFPKAERQRHQAHHHCRVVMMIGRRRTMPASIAALAHVAPPRRPLVGLMDRQNNILGHEAYQPDEADD
ncbi:hypothetical protein C7U61_00015 [Rhizobium sp. JAB6]|nr:hypothetical protein C7U61_00015 [Rhizobium sp. JAB6]